MNTVTSNKTKWIGSIGLFVIVCGISAAMPLWLNPCGISHLSNNEIDQLRTQQSWERLSLRQQEKALNYYREMKVPCGAQNLPLHDKLEAARFQAGIVDELEYLNVIVLQIEFLGIVEGTDLYHYKGYTFFFIPVFDAVAGGSGYYEISIWPFLPEGE
jgi:hypothetical protein